MQLVDLTGIIVDSLRGTIPNPHTSGNWIYSDYPRMDATFPRISITNIAGSLTEIGIGEWTGEGVKGMLCTVDYDIDVWVKVEDRTEIPAGTIYVGTKLRDKYSDLIVDYLDNMKEGLKTTYGILDVEFLNITSVPLDEEHMLHRKTITIRFTFVWGL